MLLTWFLHVIFQCANDIFIYLQEIVALSGAHTLGRSRPERSGWGKPETKYTVLKLPCSQGH